MLKAAHYVQLTDEKDREADPIIMSVDLGIELGNKLVSYMMMSNLKELDVPILGGTITVLLGTKEA